MNSFMREMPVSFPGLFPGLEINIDPVALHIGHGIYWYGIIIACGFLLAVGVAMIGVVFAHNFIIKFVLTAAILFIYCNYKYIFQVLKIYRCDDCSGFSQIVAVLPDFADISDKQSFYIFFTDI